MISLGKRNRRERRGRQVRGQWEQLAWVKMAMDERKMDLWFVEEVNLVERKHTVALPSSWLKHGISFRFSVASRSGLGRCWPPGISSISSSVSGGTEHSLDLSFPLPCSARVSVRFPRLWVWEIWCAWLRDTSSTHPHGAFLETWWNSVIIKVTSWPRT